jgi:hypothetical protein
MAKRRGKKLRTRIRDIDRGYKKLMRRLGVKARKARRSAGRSFKAAKGSVKKAIRDARRKGPSAKAANAWRVTVGIHEQEGAEQHEAEDNFGEGFGQASPPTIVEVASFNEFGLGVPQRSFIRGWADENEAENRENLRKIGQAVVKGKLEGGAKQGLERFGLLAVAGIQKRMSDGIDPPNAPSTVAAKKSSKPLINTGQLRSSVTFKVFKPSKDDK